MDDVRRVDLGRFIHPAEETGTGGLVIEAVQGYLVRTPRHVVLSDSGLGEADAETEAWYGPGGSRCRRPWPRPEPGSRTWTPWSTAICTSTTSAAIRCSPVVR